jgi:hypothetical protein
LLFAIVTSTISGTKPSSGKLGFGIEIYFDFYNFLRKFIIRALRAPNTPNLRDLNN